MTFDWWWDSDERREIAHEDERTRAKAAWNAAIREAEKSCEDRQDRAWVAALHAE